MDTLKKNENVNTELRTISKNGNIIWVKVYAQPVWDYSKEKLISIYGAVQDITKRKLAEEALRMNERNLQTLIENTDGYVFAADTYYRLIVSNSRYRKEIREIVGHQVNNGEVIIEESWEKSEIHRQRKARYDRVLKGEKYYTEQKSISKTGEVVWREYYYSPIKDDKDNILGFTAFARDINERKLAEEQLKEKMNELQKFNTLMVGREFKMVELKKEINDLFVKTGKQPKYDVDFEN